MSEFTILPEPEGEEDCRPPSYKEPGMFMFEFLGIDLSPRPIYRLMIEEVFTYTGSAFWIAEGEGFAFWVDSYLDLEQPGIYVVENITGTYYRGDGWTTDDDVEWDFGLVRYATPEEIREYCP